MSIRGLKVTRYLQQRAQHQPLHARRLSCEATPRTSHRGHDGLLLANLTPHKGGRLLGQAFKTHATSTFSSPPGSPKASSRPESPLQVQSRGTVAHTTQACPAQQRAPSVTLKRCSDKIRTRKEPVGSQQKAAVCTSGRGGVERSHFLFLGLIR